MGHAGLFDGELESRRELTFDVGTMTFTARAPFLAGMSLDIEFVLGIALSMSVCSIDCSGPSDLLQALPHARRRRGGADPRADHQSQCTPSALWLRSGRSIREARSQDPISMASDRSDRRLPAASRGSVQPRRIGTARHHGRRMQAPRAAAGLSQVGLQVD